eukprot:7300339-Prymnesium_polylepis.1
MYAALRHGDNFWCDVPVQGAIGQLSGEVEYARTHFHFIERGGKRSGQKEITPSHGVSSKVTQAARGMLTKERADGSMKICAMGQPVVYGDLLGQYPAMPLIEKAAAGGSEKEVWLAYFRMEERTDGSGGKKPLPPEQLPWLLSGPTPSVKEARSKALTAALSQLKHAAVIDTDREGPDDPRTYDDGAWLRRLADGARGKVVIEERAVPGSFRNEDKAPATQAQLCGFVRSLQADAVRFTGGVVRTWGADMVKHLERIDDGSGKLIVVDALAGVRSFMPDAKPSKGFALGADFLVPIFYPGVKYKHKGLADAKMIGGIVTGFFEAYIEYYGLTEADLAAAISQYA